MADQTLITNGGQLLASLRQQARLTQKELAQKADISRSMISQLEIGERRPSQKLIQVLCRAMNASVENERQLLLAYHFSPTGETPEQIAAFLRADKNLSPEQADQIAELVREAYRKALDAE